MLKSDFRREGQQLIEYLLLFTIVIVILIVFLRPGGLLHKTINGILEVSIDEINKEANKI